MNTSSGQNQNISGWNTYASHNSLGITFKYPPGWTIEERDPSANCAQDSVTAISAPASEIANTFNELGLYYSTQPSNISSIYYIQITRAGKYDTNKCGPPEQDWSGTGTEVIKSSDMIMTGLLKGDAITYIRQGGLSGLVTHKYYDGSTNILTDNAIIPLKSQQYQFTIVMGYQTGYTSHVPVIDISTLKTTDLYKDTQTILTTIN